MFDYFQAWKFDWLKAQLKPQAFSKLPPFSPPKPTLIDGLNLLRNVSASLFQSSEFKEAIQRAFVKVGLAEEASGTFRSFTGSTRGTIARVLQAGGRRAGRRVHAGERGRRDGSGAAPSGERVRRHGGRGRPAQRLKRCVMACICVWGEGVRGRGKRVLLDFNCALERVYPTSVFTKKPVWPEGVCWTSALDGTVLRGSGVPCCVSASGQQLHKWLASLGVHGVAS